MTIDELYQHIQDTHSAVSRDGNTITVGGGLDLRGLTTLPSGVTLSAWGDLNLGSLAALLPGVTLSAGGNLNLDSLTTLPEGVVMSSKGYLYLGSLTTLSPGVTISTRCSLNLGSLTTLPEGAAISAGGYLNLGSLGALSKGAAISAGGRLFLGGLTTLSKGAALSTGGGLDLGGLTTLPEGVTISAGGLCFGNVSGPYRGLTLASYDGIISELVGEPKMVGEYSVQRANYFLSSNRADRGHYIAVRGEHSAHGSTVRAAVEDCAAKALAVDPSTAISAIRASGTVTLAQYRALTGACREGCRQWAASNGLDGREEITIEELRPMLAGVYGSVEFLGAIA